MHDDEEIRYALDGSAFFDIRGKSHLVNYNSRANWACPRGVHRPMDSHSRRCRGSSCPSGWNLPPLHPRRAKRYQGPPSVQGQPLLTPSRTMALVYRVLTNPCRLQENPKWTPLNRSEETDVNPYRVDYVREVREITSHA